MIDKLVKIFSLFDSKNWAVWSNLGFAHDVTYLINANEVDARSIILLNFLFMALKIFEKLAHIFLSDFFLKKF